MIDLNLRSHILRQLPDVPERRRQNRREILRRIRILLWLTIISGITILAYQQRVWGREGNSPCFSEIYLIFIVGFLVVMGTLVGLYRFKPGLRSYVRRAGILLWLAGLIAIVIWSLQDNGHCFYEIHDNLYLGLKGEFWFRHFPISLGFWALAGLLICITIMVWLSQMSVIWRPHIWILERIIRHPEMKLIGGLDLSLRFFRLLRIRPYLILEVAEKEREIAMGKLGYNKRLSKVDEKQCRLIYDLTGYIMQWREYIGWDEISYLEAIERWYHYYVLLCAYADPFASWIKRDEQDIPVQFATLKNHAMFNALTNATSLTLVQFQPETLIDNMTILMTRPPNIDYSHIAEMIASRQALFNQAYNILQESLLSNTGQQFPLPRVNLTPELCSIVGRIALDIACHIALILDMPMIAQSYLEVCDSLILMTQTFRSQAFLVDIASLAHLVGNLPAIVTDAYPMIHSMHAYWLVAQLSNQQLTNYQEQWRSEIQRKTSGSGKDANNLMKTDDYAYETKYLNSIFNLPDPPEK